MATLEMSQAKVRNDYEDKGIIPCFKVTQPVDQNIEVYCFWRIKVVFIPECFARSFFVKSFVKGVLHEILAARTIHARVRLP